MRPIDVINDLKSHYINTDIDWEMILEHGYRCFLSSESVVLDIGAHAGRHSHVFVTEIGCAEVDIVEPLASHAQTLHDRYAEHSHVRIHQCALGHESGRTEFIFNAGAPEESGLRERRYNDPAAKTLEKLQVDVSTLDSLCANSSRLDFIKIDTEGGEVDILRGGDKTLRSLRPILSVEYGAAGYEVYGHERATLFRLAEELGYGLFDLFGNALASAEDWDECADNFYWDYFMAPKERGAEFRDLLRGQLERVDACLMRPAR